MGLMRYSRHVNRKRRWLALRALVIARDGHQCRECGAVGRLEVDHVKPVKTHPELAWSIENLQLLCPHCHSVKTLIEMGRIEVASIDRSAWRSAVRALEKRPLSEGLRCLTP